jgi:hypothetical protein
MTRISWCRSVRAISSNTRSSVAAVSFEVTAGVSFGRALS